MRYLRGIMAIRFGDFGMDFFFGVVVTRAYLPELSHIAKP